MQFFHHFKKKVSSGIIKMTPLRLRKKIFSILDPSYSSNLQHAKYVINKNGHSFKSLIENNCLFIHIPKTAGISVAQSLFGNLGAGHWRAKDYYLVFDYKEINNFKKFTFVRNPWDRLVSAYLYLKKGGMVQFDDKWSKKHLSEFNNFNDFVLHGLRNNAICNYLHFQPQYQYLNLGKNKFIDLDFIGYYENLNDDFHAISKMLNIKSGLITTNVNSSKDHYTRYYTPETIEIVREFYKKDIEILGYNFNNSNVNELINMRKLHI